MGSEMCIRDRGYSGTSTVGSGFGRYQTKAGVTGHNNWGTSYHFGVAGYCYDDNSSYPYGGVIGAATISASPAVWGALGYKVASGVEYGGYFNGNAMTTGSHYLTNTNTRILQGAGNSVRMQTNSGYIDVGPQNTTWAHIYTDRPSFYFNKEL